MASVKAAAAKITAMGNIPLYVLTATDPDRFNTFIKDSRLQGEMLQAWTRMQQDLLHLSRGSRQVLVPGSGHYIHQDQPAAVEAAIKEMLGQLQQHPPATADVGIFMRSCIFMAR
ncbi:MAG: alpha/beta hydrolase [Chitinophaga sp.]|uniref:alpha/beta fold hydrolase n=1 Tax=Chitinophaga sp. TaxID=1869181 RepID=UPI001B035793|nr:alpha/beta hydrolase [Chitinophaga sp.]MBO9731454.1 alpha/beta hydrolase [Chitinophaga sp.]